MKAPQLPEDKQYCTKNGIIIPTVESTSVTATELLFFSSMHLMFLVYI